VDVALVVADAELAADLGAVFGNAAALRLRMREHARIERRERRRGNGLARGGRERLRDLAVVAVDRDRLDAELPSVDH
jgi:hypothetical protein